MNNCNSNLVIEVFKINTKGYVANKMCQAYTNQVKCLKRATYLTPCRISNLESIRNFTQIYCSRGINIFLFFV